MAQELPALSEQKLSQLLEKLVQLEIEDNEHAQLSDFDAIFEGSDLADAGTFFKKIIYFTVAFNT